MKDRLVCLNMIVKNESTVIHQCLSSVKRLIDYWVIVDTGSTDGTQEKIRKILSDVPGELFERPWVNFAHNRNEALELAKGKGDYLLTIDADEKLCYSSNFSWPKLTMDCYLAMFSLEQIQFGRIFLLNNRLDWEWVGAVHEELRGKQAVPRNGSFFDGISVETISGSARSKDPDRYLKDARLLEQSLLKEPDHSRSVFYLALSYDCANLPEAALKNYIRRSQMEGSSDELYYSFYRIARLQEMLNFSADEFVLNYQKAHQLRPFRAEPLYWLARYYLSIQNFDAAETLLNQAIHLPKPQDMAYVESAIYQYESLVLFTNFLMQKKRYSEAAHIMRQLIKNPSLPDSYRKQIHRLMQNMQSSD